MIQCPANYFGEGEDYSLPDDPSILQEFSKKFEEWERNHPDDPTGEKALASYKAKHGEIEYTKKEKTPRVLEDDEELVKDNSECVNLRLQVPMETCRLFKNYAKFRRMRPRELLILWVTKYAKL